MTSNAILAATRVPARAAIILGALCVAGCMSPDEADRRARDVVEASGYTNVVMTGVEWWACGEDTYCRGFVADAPNGSRVTGAAGSDNAKGWTIRVTGVAKSVFTGERLAAPTPTGPQS